MICEKCNQHVELGVGPSDKTYHALCLIEHQAEQINSLQAERDAAYAAGFEACREEAVARLERDAEALAGYGQSLTRSRAFRQCAEKVRALQHQKKGVSGE